VENVLVYDFVGPFVDIYVEHITQALSKRFTVTPVGERRLHLISSDSLYPCVVSFVDGTGITVESAVPHTVIEACLTIENEINRRSGRAFGRRMSCDVDLALLGR
jgi:hypothetical protein